jgi:hypothetical protein
MPDKSDGQTKWLKPEWFPEGGKGILFIDEANRAPRDVIQSVFQLVRDRRMHTHELPAGWRIVSAGNYESAGYDVRRMDEAFLSRFLHINVEANADDLCEYATLNGWTSRTIEFLRSNTGMMIKPCDASSLYEPAPDPRRWDMVDRIVKTGRLEGSLLMAALSGLVGTAAAKAYKDFSGEGIHFRDVLAGKVSFEKLTEKDHRKLATEVVPLLKDTKFSEKRANVLSEFIRLLNKDLGTMVAKSILAQLTTSEWAKYLREDKEILKYFEFLFGNSESK